MSLIRETTLWQALETSRHLGNPLCAGPWAAVSYVQRCRRRLTAATRMKQTRLHRKRHPRWMRRLGLQKGGKRAQLPHTS